MTSSSIATLGSIATLPLTQSVDEMCKTIIVMTVYPRWGPGWRGAVQILSTMPTVDWVLLGSGESTRGRHLAAFTCRLTAGRTLPLELHVIMIIIIIPSWRVHTGRSGPGAGAEERDGPGSVHTSG